MARHGITYTYDTGEISHFSAIRIESDCKINPERTVNVGVFCRSCDYYHGIRGKYVICSHPQNENYGPGATEVHSEIVEEIREKAITHFYD